MNSFKLNMCSSPSRLIFLFIIILKFYNTDGGNVSFSFDDASSGVADVRTILNTTNNVHQVSPLPDATDIAKSTVHKPYIMPAQPSATLHLPHFPRNLIKSSLRKNSSIDNIKSTTSLLNENSVVMNSLKNTSQISSTLQKGNKLDSNLVETMQIKNKTILPCVTSNRTRDDDRISKSTKNICIEEDCVIASATILSSLDRSKNPCENFYDFACGGWVKKALEMSTDRFQMMDKKNRKLLQNILEERETKSENDKTKDAKSTKEKARSFYKSCVQDSEEQNKENVQDLLNFIIDFGGSSFESLKEVNSVNDKISFNERIQSLHTKYGLNVFFTWGVIDVEKERRLAIISGGFNLGLVDDDFNRQQYLNIMRRIINLLSEAQDNEIVVDLEYGDIISDSSNETEFESSSTSLINVTYEYEDITEDYNPSYDYKELSYQRNNVDLAGNANVKESLKHREKIATSNIGNTLLDFFKKPIEWIIPSSSTNRSGQKTDNSYLFQSNSLSNNSRKSMYSQSITRKENDSRSSKDENINSSETVFERAFDKNYIPRQTASLIRSYEDTHSS